MSWNRFFPFFITKLPEGELKSFPLPGKDDFGLYSRENGKYLPPFAALEGNALPEWDGYGCCCACGAFESRGLAYQDCPDGGFRCNRCGSNSDPHFVENFVLVHYASDRFDSHGGFVAIALDLARAIDAGELVGIELPPSTYAQQLPEVSFHHQRGAVAQGLPPRRRQQGQSLSELSARAKEIEREEPQMAAHTVKRNADGTIARGDALDAQEETPPTRKARVKGQAKEIGSAMGLGVALAGANEAGEILVDLAKDALGDVPTMQAILEHPDGRELVKVLMAIIVHTGASQTNAIPKAELVKAACNAQITAASFTLLAPRLKQLRKHFVKLASVGEQLENAPAIQARVEEEDEDLEEGVEAELHSLKTRTA